MNKPTDYPVDVEHADAASDAPATDITYAVLKDRVEAQQPVTDEMIRIARTKLDTAYINNAVLKTETDQGKFKLSSIANRFKI